MLLSHGFGKKVHLAFKGKISLALLGANIQILG
jgi:hypothetical protein